MSHTVAKLMVDTLHQAGVKRIYGVVGDSLNGFTDAMRSQPDMQWMHMRHEEAAAFAAGCASFSSATDSPPASEGSASDGAAASVSLRDDRTSATASPERVRTDPSAATIAAGRLSAKACRTFATSGAGASESAVGASFRNGSSSYKS